MNLLRSCYYCYISRVCLSSDLLEHHLSCFIWHFSLFTLKIAPFLTSLYDLIVGINPAVPYMDIWQLTYSTYCPVKSVCSSYLSRMPTDILSLPYSQDRLPHVWMLSLYVFVCVFVSYCRETTVHSMNWRHKILKVSGKFLLRY
jgi:hypothetical protein